MLGTGIIQSFATTAKNFVGSFHDPARFVTVQYPEEPAPLAANYRNFPFLIYDAGDDPMGTLRCVACRICEKECPPQCIYIVPAVDEKGKPRKHPRVFDLDVSVCMSCQICVEVCPFDAIKMDQVFALATADRFHGLLLRKEDLAKPNSYYQQIHPAEAAEVDARLAGERRQAEEKARATATPPAAAPGAAAVQPPRPGA
ncbi:MAG TPA: 4Fe-4S dicluster domain-containing protein [Opitutaceae bacterium]|nr:4Fe-4S dicluster domain-containing protein [Opitutaceae bacterium]